MGILSSLFLYTSLKICSCSGRPLNPYFVRSSLESSTILSWLTGDVLSLRDGMDCYDLIHQVN